MIKWINDNDRQAGKGNRHGTPLRYSALTCGLECQMFNARLVSRRVNKVGFEFKLIKSGKYCGPRDIIFCFRRKVLGAGESRTSGVWVLISVGFIRPTWTCGRWKVTFFYTFFIICHGFCTFFIICRGFSRSSNWTGR